jgi:dihydroorotase
MPGDQPENPMSEAAEAREYDLVLKGGRVLDERNGVDGILDVAVKAGRIAAVGKDLAAGASHVEDAAGAIVAPGLIDIHTHVYHKATSLSVDPGFISRRSATTTLVDAGSAGAGNYDGFRDYVMAQSPYRIFAFLNISFPGIFGFDKDVMIGEATLREMLPVHRCVAKIEENRDRIVGVKVRIGGPVTGELSLGALELALEAANAVGLPLMTHIGTAPPSYADVVSMLRPGDILTHCFRPAPNSALNADGTVLKAVRDARERGVLFDIAHGMGAFGYETTEGALSQNFLPDLISSDVHVIAVEGPGYDLLHTMSKLLNCGLTLPQVIGMSTSRPALAIRRPELGHLGVGAPADITVLKQVDSDYVFEDVTGAKRQGSTLLQPVAVYLAGRQMELARRPFEEPFIGSCGHDHRH